MAYNICKDLLSNIGVQCGDQVAAGFTGRALLAPKASSNFTKDTNGDILTWSSDDMVLVDNVWANAMDGTQANLVTDNGRPAYHHDLGVRVPRTDAVKTRNTVKALATQSLCGIFEREDGTYLAVGFYGKMIATAQTQAENASAGDWVNTLGVDESMPEVLLVDTPAVGSTPAVTAKSKFDTLWDAIVTAA